MKRREDDRARLDAELDEQRRDRGLAGVVAVKALKNLRSICFYVAMNNLQKRSRQKSLLGIAPRTPKY